MADTGEKKNSHSILIVDDDVFLLDMYALKFREHGFTVETALGSMAAFEKIKNGYAPEVMVLDIVMPEMDGFELLEKLKDERLGDKTMKIILSNRGQASDIDRGKSLGASGYIVKAKATPSEVVAKVNEIMSKVMNA